MVARPGVPGEIGRMPAAPFCVALIQDGVAPTKAETLERTMASIRAAHGRGAQVICLKELFDAPYFCKKLDPERFDLAEPVPGPTVQRLATLAKELEVVLVVPLYERQAPGMYRNSAVVIDADGTVQGVYRKMHIPHDPLYEEKYYFAPGESHDPSQPAGLRGPAGEAGGFMVWKTRYATIGVLICWDQWYPEAARVTSLLGADILLYPTAIGWHPAEKAESGPAQVEAWRTTQRAHAIVNGVFVAAANRAGFEAEDGTNGIEFFGHSFVCDPLGRLLAEAETGDAIVVATCDPRRIEETRRHWPFLRDRRVDAYWPILNRWFGPREG
jgi:N-carbamoylputrescine amidase